MKRHSVAKIATFAIINFAALWGIWLLYTCTLKPIEAAAGAAAAVVGTIGVAVVEGQRFARFSPKLKWLMLFLLEPWYVITGTWAIFWALLKRIAGRESEAQLKAIPFEAGSRESSEDAARRALVIALTTIPPNFIVVGVDITNQVMLVHQVSPSGTPWVTKQVGARA